MREILFRAKSVRGGEWVEGSLIHIGDYCCILPLDCEDYGVTYLDGDLGSIDGEAVPVIRATVGQFTGLTDKNNKKIFEGDIVRAMMDWGPAGMKESVVDIGFKRLQGYRWNYFDLDTIEVIGNVYDNPELLEAQK
jgi:uncharacterized phage protein (TIGR01671 family)